MSTHSFFANLTATIEFSDEEFETLWSSAKNHYDYAVQSSTEQGGFLYGGRNRRTFSDGTDKTIHLTWRQSDILLKALEFPLTEEKLKISIRLNQIMNEWKEKHNEINKQLSA